MLEYAPEGLIGVLTPQANTTVEPEFSILCPPGYGLVTARLTSDKPSMDDRLVDYGVSLETTLDRFANMPLGVVLFACTGASYLVEPEQEKAIIAKIEAERGLKLITATDAIADALDVLGAANIGIVSPYGDPLHDHALGYWARRGVGIAKVARIKSVDAAFHPIYALGAKTSKEQLEKLVADNLDAVAMLGTGLPTLPAILAAKARPAPVISPNLCLMWSAMLALRGEAPSAENLGPWLDGSAWRARLAFHTQGQD
ncbi:MAG: maleate cis-trans isomerase family protein [Geminicoccaceae bacterium]